MGAYKQAQLEEEDRQRRRMRKDDWPRCDRCSEPIDYDMVPLTDDGIINPFFTPDLCSRCKYYTS